jgi:molybdenum cofactor cytidylyltransferase
MRFGVAILGAGASRRMGRPKLLLPWRGTTVIGHLVRQWRELEATQIAVVLAADNTALATELDRIALPSADRVVNPTPDDGMFSSIRCAAAWPGWAPDLSHVVIALGDQPHVGPDSLRALLTFADAQPDGICQPAFAGRRKHPVVLPRSLLAELPTSPANTLAEFLTANLPRIAAVELDDPGLQFDMDTPADYERLRDRAG